MERNNKSLVEKNDEDNYSDDEEFEEEQDGDEVNEEIKNGDEENCQILKETTSELCLGECYLKGSSSEIKINKTFSTFQLREIDNDNNVLMKKVLAHSVRPNQHQTRTFTPKLTSAEVNRRKFQKKINRENLVRIFLYLQKLFV